MARTIRIVLAHHARIVLIGLQHLLALETDLEVVELADDSEHALSALRIHRPDALIIDAALPGGGALGVLSALRLERLPTRSVLTGAALSSTEIAGGLQLGARGILPTERAAADAVRCLRIVANAGYWLDGARTDSAMISSLAYGARQGTGSALTPRERQLAECVAEGLRNAAIAQRLGITEGTVKVHLNRVFRKLGASSRVAVARALDRPASV